MLPQLITTLTLLVLISADCPVDSSLNTIASYPLTVTNLPSSSETHNYPLPIQTQLSSRLALSIYEATSVPFRFWNFTAQVSGQQYISLSFSQPTSNWARISCILLVIDNPFIFSGFYTIQQPNKYLTMYQLFLPQPIQNEESSVAMLFLNGISFKQGQITSVSLTAFRVINQAIHMNIKSEAIQNIDKISLSYLVFSPIKADFISAGNLLSIQPSSSTQYIDLFRNAYNPPLKLFGIAGVTSIQDKLTFNLGIDNNLMLSATTSSGLSISYLMLSPNNISCANCPFQIAYMNKCVQKCPSNTVKVSSGGLSFCRMCSSKLNLEVSASGLECTCKNNYQVNSLGQCALKTRTIPLSVTMKASSTQSATQSPQNSGNQVFLPPSISLQTTQTTQSTQTSTQSSQSSQISTIQTSTSTQTSQNSQTSTQTSGQVQTPSSTQTSTQSSAQNPPSGSQTSTQTSTQSSAQNPPSGSQTSAQTSTQSSAQNPPSGSQTSAQTSIPGIQVLTLYVQHKQPSSAQPDQIQNFQASETNQTSTQSNTPEPSTQTESQKEGDGFEGQQGVYMQEGEQDVSADEAPEWQQNRTEQSSQTGRNTSYLNETELLDDGESNSTQQIYNDEPQNVTDNLISQSTQQNIQQKTVQTQQSNVKEDSSKPPIISLTVSNSINSCTSVPNTVLIGSRCLCRVGFVNISNHCAPIGSLVLQTIDPGKTIKVLSACPSPDLVYSSSTKSCVCNQGYSLDSQGKCKSICSASQKYNKKLNKCECMFPYARIGGICVRCQVTGPFSGKEACYPLPATSVCRSNYTQSQQFCILCSGIVPQFVFNGECINCLNGFIYDGSKCSCPVNSHMSATVCVGNNCGNGKLDKDETCDDGNSINGDGCSSTCRIQSGYWCGNVSTACVKTVCGDGLIEGSQKCDDKNIQDGDGCSSLCLVETKSTCLGVPSRCFLIRTGNLSLVSVYINSNNAYVELKTPKPIIFPDPILAQTFIKVNFLTSFLGATPYCQQQVPLDKFVCLLIYPNGTPLTRQFVEFSYAFGGESGTLIVQISSGITVSSSLRRKGRNAH